MKSITLDIGVLILLFIVSTICLIAMKKTQPESFRLYLIFVSAVNVAVWFEFFLFYAK